MGNRWILPSRRQALTNSRPRVAYISGPIDAAEVYDEWRRAQHSQYYGTIYLLQLYDIIADIGAEALIITNLDNGRWSTDREGVRIVNLPSPQGVAGIRYHLAMLSWVFRCLTEVIKFRADIALMTAGQTYFWAFALLRLWRVRLIASLHCTLWPPYARRKRSHRFLMALNGLFFYPLCEHIQAVSQEAARQIRLTARRLRSEPVRFLATYDAKRFAEVINPEWPERNEQFRLLFVGRIIENKGVFDLVQIMERLQQGHSGKFKLDICGTGPAEAELRQIIERANLSGIINVRGQCGLGTLQSLYANSHAVIVPTRSDFEEGTPKVAFEAVLNFRPVVMSAACPALADVADATEEAGVDNVEDYVSAILRLAGDRQVYESRVRGAVACRQKHFDERNSYGSKLRAYFVGFAEAHATGTPTRNDGTESG